MITHLFYLIGIIPFFFEVIHIIYTDEMLSIRNMSKGLNSEQHKFLLKHSVEFRNRSIMNLIYTLWVLIGLCTFQWWAFLLLLALGFTPKSDNRMVVIIDGYVSLAIICFIMVNKYYLHII